MIVLFSLFAVESILQVKSQKSPRQVESHSSYQHNFYGVDNRTHSGVYNRTQSGVTQTKKSVQGTHPGERHSAVS